MSVTCATITSSDAVNFSSARAPSGLATILAAPANAMTAIAITVKNAAKIYRLLLVLCIFSPPEDEILLKYVVNII